MMEVKTGLVITPETFPKFTREQLKAYADASGDFNPIHQDDEAAQKIGLPGIIVHGMLSAAYMAERAEKFVREECGRPDWILEKFQSRFKAIAYPGDALTVTGTVKEATDSLLILDLKAMNQKGELTLNGSARYRK
jgi:acyl dehydratase